MDRSITLDLGDDTFHQSPVDDDLFGELLADAVAGHSGNLNAFQAMEPIVFRDDPTIFGWTVDDISTHTRAQELNASGVPIYHWGSWMDAGSADGVIRAFMEATGPRMGTIGSWTHDLSLNAYAGLTRSPPVPSYEAQWNEALNFFDDHLRKDNPNQDRVLRYFTMGENLWKATSEWPIPGTETRTFFLAENGILSPSAPSSAQGEDTYLVDFEAVSATESRWLSPLFADTWYPDRNSRDNLLLVYQSEILSEDMEVTGYPVIHLQLSSTHADGAFFVYLEDVDTRGRVNYVTEGVLRGIHRRVSPDPSAWKRPVPYHSYTASQVEALVPGEVTELAFGFQPTSFLFREGHRIRIAIAGHDGSAFRRIPAQGIPELRVQRNQLYPSRIELPVIPR
jgi:putative CocE/NonD family hydrolase